MTFQQIVFIQLSTAGSGNMVTGAYMTALPPLLA
jgi:hypothetical protein